MFPYSPNFPGLPLQPSPSWSKRALTNYLTSFCFKLNHVNLISPTSSSILNCTQVTKRSKHETKIPYSHSVIQGKILPAVIALSPCSRSCKTSSRHRTVRIREMLHQDQVTSITDTVAWMADDHRSRSIDAIDCLSIVCISSVFMHSF